MLGLIKDRLITIILVIAILGIIGVGIWYAMFYEADDDTSKNVADTDTATTNHIKEETNITEENTVETNQNDVTDLTEWVGVYRNDSGKSFYLVQTTSFTQIFGNIGGVTESFTLQEDGSLLYESSLWEESIKIIPNVGYYTVEDNREIEDNYSGEYYKVEFSSNWTGVYQNNAYCLIMSEVQTGTMRFSITSTDIVISYEVTEYNDDSAKYIEESDGVIINFTKDTSGITLQIEDSSGKLSNAAGTYTKIQ